MLSILGALLLGRLEIILVISSEVTGAQNMLLQVYLQCFWKSNCPHGFNVWANFSPMQEKYSFNLLQIILGSVISSLL